MADPDHIMRGVHLVEDCDVPGEWDADDRVLGEYYCRDCESPIRLRARVGEAAYVRLGCDCGAVELALRIAGGVDGGLEDEGIEQWERRDVEREIA